MKMLTQASNSRRTRLESCWPILPLILLPCWGGMSIAQQRTGKDKSTPSAKRNAPPTQAQHDFETRCSACHGLDGQGGEHAPNIATNPTVHLLTSAALFKIVRDGIPAKGMPAFDYLPAEQIKSIVTYLRLLGGQPGGVSPRGNVARGEALFFGKAECGTCHMMRGKGGFLGADLTEYGEAHTPDELRQAILNPGMFPDSHREMVELVTRTGEHLSGVIRNEDNFSLQLQGADGTFHMLSKSDVDHIRRTGNEMTHTDNAQRLSGTELDDLVCYVSQRTRESAGTILSRHLKAKPVRNPQH